MSIKSCLVRASLAALFASPCGLPQAASLQVAPVLVEVPAPGATATLKLRNEGTKPLDAQIRIFQWTQVDGADVLTPTIDVVASPPAASLRPNTDYTVRIVRTKKEPVASEEAYRLLIDELPGPATTQVNSVFFTLPGAAPKLSWELQRRANKPVVVANNTGDRRIRLAKLKITDGKGGVASFGDGLAGYVLSHASMNFVVPANARGFGVGGLASISAQSDIGPIDVRP
jgi:fimbrial chaperone protein